LSQKGRKKEKKEKREKKGKKRKLVSMIMHITRASERNAQMNDLTNEKRINRFIENPRIII